MEKWKNYICTNCGHIYCQKMGDPDRNDIPKGTPFKNIPNDWICPKCGASKDQFKPYNGTQCDE